jgi:hypothetical protein
MKKQNAHPRYLDALLTKHLTPDTSRAYQDAVRYLEQANKTIEKGNSKTSAPKK